ncbi:uncharacterized protein LOC100177826 [Ciona intestinalis]
MSVLTTSGSGSSLPGLHHDQFQEQNAGPTPYGRLRRQSSRGSLSLTDKIGGLTSPPGASGSVGSNDTSGSNTNAQRQRSSSMVPLSRKASQVQVIAPPTRRRLVSLATTGNLSIGSGMDLKQSAKQLPILSEHRRMNMQDVLIWQKFTRKLRQRVEDRKSGKPTFCWLDRPLTRDLRRNGLPSIEMEPTYKMTPDEKPSMVKCKKIVDDYLQKRLKGIEYDSLQDVCQLSRSISDEIRNEIKDKAWKNRYKCVVYVTLGQKLDQAVMVSSLCSWDPRSDSYVSCNFQNSSLFCSVSVFAVYFE